MFSGYIRVSDVAGRNGESFISPSVQRDTIQRLAASKGLKLGEIVEELDVSGGKSIDERALGRLVRAVEAKESEGIIVWKVSRFSRSQLDAVTVMDRIDKAGGRLLADDFDSKGPMAKAMRGLMSGLAEEERDARREGWAQARSHAIERGAYPTKTPYGYGRDGKGRLVPNEHAETVRKMFTLKAEGQTLSAIASALKGTPSPSGGSKWPHSTLAQVLRNRAYLGEAKHGPYANAQAHEPLVAASVFEVAQVARSYRVPNGDPRSNSALLLGIARCAGCGHTLKVVLGHAGRLRYYCKSASYSEPCNARALVRADELDPFVAERFLDEFKARLRAPTAVKASAELEAAEAEARQADEALRIYVTTAEAIVDADVFRQGLEARQSQLEAAREHAATLRSQAVSLAALPSGDPVAAWEAATTLQRRSLVAAMVDRVEVEKGPGSLAKRATLVWR
jgi:site-specific DNA recombinase